MILVKPYKLHNYINHYDCLSFLASDSSSHFRYSYSPENQSSGRNTMMLKLIKVALNLKLWFEKELLLWAWASSSVLSLDSLSCMYKYISHLKALISDNLYSERNTYYITNIGYSFKFDWNSNFSNLTFIVAKRTTFGVAKF